MRFAVAALALTLSTTAFAGGIGPMLTGGMHTERVDYYTTIDPDSGAELTDPNDYKQYQLNQAIPNFGGGLEFVLGDRGSRILGVFRAYWMMDTPQADPGKRTKLVEPEFVVANWREKSRQLGVGTVGLQFGLVGRPESFIFGVGAHVGSAFLTSDRSEFLLVQVGPMINYRMGPSFQLWADVSYNFRFRKTFEHGATANVGVRYLFD